MYTSKKKKKRNQEVDNAKVMISETKEATEFQYVGPNEESHCTRYCVLLETRKQKCLSNLQRSFQPIVTRALCL